MELKKSRKPKDFYLVVADADTRVIPRGIIVALSDIQPSECELRKESVDYFLANPEKVYNRKAKIVLVKSKDKRFKFCVRDGNNRMYTLFMNGITRVYIIPDYRLYYDALIPEVFISSAVLTYEDGIRTWADLSGNILPDAEYDS